MAEYRATLVSIACVDDVGKKLGYHYFIDSKDYFHSFLLAIIRLPHSVHALKLKRLNNLSFPLYFPQLPLRLKNSKFEISFGLAVQIDWTKHSVSLQKEKFICYYLVRAGEV